MAYEEMEKQKKAGKSVRSIVVARPMPAFTLRIVTVNNMPVAVPTCIGHLMHSDQSRLAVVN